jgi:hypothetical protein
MKTTQSQLSRGLTSRSRRREQMRLTKPRLLPASDLGVMRSGGAADVTKVLASALRQP